MEVETGPARALLERLAAAAAGPGRVVDDPDAVSALTELQRSLLQFRLSYKFGIDEVLTKVSILREEFEHSHDHSPIEHVNSRLKSLDSLLHKMVRIDCPPQPATIREQIRDIAGIRITCAFVSDVYWVAEMLTRQPDLTVVETKDYIAVPKDNGYQSLHLIVKVPVFLSERTEQVYVEVQLRTIAMDFWASLEHQIYYRYDREVPAHLLTELKQAADAAHRLDQQMARLRDEVRGLGLADPAPGSEHPVVDTEPSQRG